MKGNSTAFLKQRLTTLTIRQFLLVSNPHPSCCRFGQLCCLWFSLQAELRTTAQMLQGSSRSMTLGSVFCLLLPRHAARVGTPGPGWGWFGAMTVWEESCLPLRFIDQTQQLWTKRKAVSGAQVPRGHSWEEGLEATPGAMSGRQRLVTNLRQGPFPTP